MCIIPHNGTYYICQRTSFRVKARTGNETIHVAAVNGVFPTLSTKNGRLSWTEENTREGGKKKCCYAGPSDHCASCKMTRLSHLLSVSGHMYLRGWTKVVGDIMESRRTDGRQGLSVPHVWTSQHNGNPFFELRLTKERTNGRTERDHVGHPRENPSCGFVCATTKQQLRQRNDDSKNRQNSATLCLRWSVLWGFSSHGGFRRFAGIITAPSITFRKKFLADRENWSIARKSQSLF